MNVTINFVVIRKIIDLWFYTIYINKLKGEKAIQVRDDFTEKVARAS
jgi:hypothetical protein